MEAKVLEAEEKVADSDLLAAAERFPLNPPKTKEAYLYRSIFDRHFPGGILLGGPLQCACFQERAV